MVDNVWVILLMLE